MAGIIITVIFNYCSCCFNIVDFKVVLSTLKSWSNGRNNPMQHHATLLCENWLAILLHGVAMVLHDVT